MACKDRYYIGNKVYDAEGVKQLLKDGLLQQLINEGKVKPLATIDKEKLTPEQKDILSFFNEHNEKFKQKRIGTLDDAAWNEYLDAVKRNSVFKFKNLDKASNQAYKDVLAEYLNDKPEKVKIFEDKINKFIEDAKELQASLKERNFEGTGFKKSDNYYAGIDLDAASGIDNRTVKEIMEQGLEYASKNESAVRAMLDSVVENNRVLNANEVASLTGLKRLVTDRAEKVRDELNSLDKNSEEYRNKKDQWNQLLINDEDILMKIAQASWTTANAQSMAFRLRQYLLDEDYNVFREVAKAEKANGGEEISPEIRKEIEGDAEKFKTALNKKVKAEKELEKLESIEKTRTAIKSISQTKTPKTIVQPIVKDNQLRLTEGYVKQFIEQGHTEPEDLIKAIQKDLVSKDIISTDRQVMDAVSGYGYKQFREKTDIDDAFSRAKTLFSLLAKKEDVSKGELPIPQTPEARKASDLEKKHRRELNELLKQFDFTPEQLAERDAEKLNSLKSRYENLITKEKEKNKKVYDLDIPSVIGKDKLLGSHGEKEPIHLTKDEAETKGENNQYLVEQAIQSGQYIKDIQDGKLSATDVVAIIESYGLNPNRKILDAKKEEVRNARKYFTLPEEVKRQLKLTDEILQRKIALQEIKEDTKRRLDKIAEAQWSTGRRVLEGFLNVASLSKSAKAMLDMGHLLRQGIFYTTNSALSFDKKKLKGLKEATMASAKYMFKNPDEFEAYMKQLKTTDAYHKAHLFGLDLADATHVEEEYFGTKIVNALPIIGDEMFGKSLLQGTAKAIHAEKYTKGIPSTKGLQIGKRSEASYSGFLNMARLQMFTEALNNFQDSGAIDINTKEGVAQAKALAKYINCVTGRGSLGQFEQAGQTLAKVLFSPKYMMSRIQILNPMYYAKLPGTKNVNAVQHVLNVFSSQPPSVRAYATQQTLKYFAAQAVLQGGLALGIAMMTSGDDNEEKEEGVVGNSKLSFDVRPNSTNFLKVKMGDSSFGFTGGYFDFPRLITQLVKGEKISQSGKTSDLNKSFGTQSRGTVAFDYFKNKSAPITGLMYDELIKKKENERPRTTKEWAQDLMIPLIVDNAISNYELNGTGKATALNALEFIGANASTYNPDDFNKYKINAASGDGVTKVKTSIRGGRNSSRSIGRRSSR